MSYYKLVKSLGKYRAFETEEIVNTGFSGEVITGGIDQFYNGSFSANIYTNGELNDIEINGWTFGFNIKGYFHLPGSYQTTSFPIEALDPDGTEVTFYNTPHKVHFRDGDMLCSYLNLIHIYSHFENADIARNFYHLLRLVNRELYKRGDGDDSITMENCRTQAACFKDYYKEHIEDCSDKSFMNLIKKTVNSAIDVLKEDIDKYKIND